VPPGAHDALTLALPMTAILGPDLGSPLSDYSVDFSMATDLDTTNLVGGRPTVRVTASLVGFGGQALFGVGWATAGATTGMFNVNASWSRTGLLGLLPFNPDPANPPNAPRGWIVAEARDQDGRISRERRLLNLQTGTLISSMEPPPGIPSITAPGGPIVGAPAVTFADRLNPPGVPGVGFVDMTAEGPGGRRWTILALDVDDATGTDTLQFPDLASAGITGLQLGTWNVRVETRVMFPVSTPTPDDFTLAERRHEESFYARSVAVPFTIQ
jgi:hypothetical protein